MSQISFLLLYVFQFESSRRFQFSFTDIRTDISKPMRESNTSTDLKSFFLCIKTVCIDHLVFYLLLRHVVSLENVQRRFLKYLFLKVYNIYPSRRNNNGSFTV
jgi:hypothetical protein